jgi:hypothetical protein
MKAYRAKNKPTSSPKPKTPIINTKKIINDNMDDFWAFVQQELKKG